MRKNLKARVEDLRDLGATDTLGVLSRGAISAFVVNILGLVISFSLHIVLTRIMGVFHYGVYVYVLSWISVLVLFATAGYDVLLLRFVALYHSTKDWSLLRGVLSRSWRVVLLWSTCCAFGVAYVTSSLTMEIDQDLKLTFLVGSALIPIWSLGGLAQSVLRALKYIFLSRFTEVVFRPVLFGLLVFTAAAIGNDLAASTGMGLFVIAAFATLVFAHYFVTRALPKEARQAVPTWQSKKWFSIALPLMFVAGTHVMLNEIDKIMIGLIRDVEEVGIYSIASRISLLILFGMQAINTIAAPMISEFHGSRSRIEFQRLVSHTTRWIFFVSIPILFVVVLVGPFILGLFGPEFRTGYIALILLSAGQLVNISVGPVGFLLTMTDNQNESLKILTFSLVLNILLNFPAIYYFGMEGAALATGFCIALRNVLMWKKARRLLRVDSSIVHALRI